jgi:hypothetical protein
MAEGLECSCSSRAVGGDVDDEADTVELLFSGHSLTRVNDGDERQMKNRTRRPLATAQIVWEGDAATDAECRLKTDDPIFPRLRENFPLHSHSPHPPSHGPTLSTTRCRRPNPRPGEQMPLAEASVHPFWRRRFLHKPAKAPKLTHPPRQIGDNPRPS